MIKLIRKIKSYFIKESESEEVFHHDYSYKINSTFFDVIRFIEIEKIEVMINEAKDNGMDYLDITNNGRFTTIQMCYKMTPKEKDYNKIKELESQIKRIKQKYEPSN